MPIDKISFRATTPQVQISSEKPAEVAIEAQPIDEEKSDATKYMIGATALAGVVALGIAGYKGHLGKGIQKFLGGAEKASTKAETPVTPENLTNPIKKTKQKLLDGEPFYGVVETKNAQLFYEDGFITQSKLPNGTFKRYDRDIDGNLKYFYVNKPKEYTLSYSKEEDGSILIKKHLAPENPDFKFTSGKEHDNGAITIETKISPDGEISKTKIESFNTSHPNYKKGKEVPLCREIDLSTGKSKTYDRSKFLRYTSSDWPKIHKEINGKKITISLHNNKFESAYHSVYNPKTNIITKQFYEMEDGKLVPTNRFEQIDKKTGNALYYEVDSNGRKVLKTLDLNNTISKKGRYYNGDKCYSVSEHYHITESDLLEKIKEKGLKFEL